MRKSPGRHRVKGHMRKGKWRASFWRGHGFVKGRPKGQRTLTRILGRSGYYTKAEPIYKDGILYEYLGTVQKAKLDQVLEERPRRIFGNYTKISREKVDVITVEEGNKVRLYAGIKR